MKNLTVALVGNPNCGKTLIFNELTNSCRRVGNWSGVTVERFEGCFEHKWGTATVVDLPGCYALDDGDGMEAIDAQVAYRAVIDAEYDLIVNILDAAHLERHLYLTLQLLELGKPMVVVINRLDCATQQGIDIDTKVLANLLTCPVIGLSAVKRTDITRLRRWLSTLLNKPSLPMPDSSARAPQPDDIEMFCMQLAESAPLCGGMQGHFWARRFLEGDELAKKLLQPSLIGEINTTWQALKSCYGEDIDIHIADHRYRHIHRILQRIHTRHAMGSSPSERIDRWLLNRWLGVPFFLAIIYATFVIAVVVGGVFQDAIDILASHLLVAWPNHMMQMWSLPYMDGLRALVVGMGQGVAVTLTFIPILMMLFFCLSWLEDCGYMARAAVVVDRIMRLIGLPGESFVALIIGLGCNVPSIMATRTLSSTRDRILTAMMAPFMSCTARLTIYALFATAFFQQARGGVVMLLYISGILVAIVTGWVLRLTVLPGKQQDLLVDLPDYSWPSWRVMGRRATMRLKNFIKRAIRWIVPVCAILTWLSHIDDQGQWVAVVDHQVGLAQLAKPLTTWFSPIGIQPDNWPATVALLTGVVAKEVVIGTLASLYQTVNPTIHDIGTWSHVLAMAWQSVMAHVHTLPEAVMTPLTLTGGDDDLSLVGALRLHFSSNSAALAYLFFVLLYFPCISTLATMVKEVGLRWGLISLLWGNMIAYAGAVLVYQGLNFSSNPAYAATSMAAVLAVVVGFALMMRGWHQLGEKGVWRYLLRKRGGDV